MRIGVFSIQIIIAMLLVWSCGEDKNAKKQPSAPNKTDSITAGSTDNTKTVLFFGNSLTAGFGVDPSEAFPALIQKKIDSLHLPYKAINAGVSGETTSGGLARVDWILRQPPAVFVLELGGNDGLRGIPLSETKKNLQGIISRVKEKSPATKIILAGMMMPPNMGSQYTRDFQAIYPALAKTNQISLIPFLLQGVGGEARLNQSDGIHPTAEGHKIVAENVWTVVKSVL
jgi:acyl-CoA thioesterase-1